MYVHLTDYPYSKISIGGLSEDNLEYAQLLADGSELMVARRDYYDATGKPQGNRMELEIPGIAFTMLDPVIEIFLK